MHDLICCLALIMLATTGDAGAARRSRAGRDPPTVQALPRRPSVVDLAGLHFDALGGALAVPTPYDLRRATIDAYLGARLGVRRRLGLVVIGAETAWRSSGVRLLGTNPILIQNLDLRRRGERPSTTIEQVHQLALGLTAGPGLSRFGWSFEPFVQGGMSASWRIFLVELDRPLAYDRSHLTAGLYGGAGFLTGIEPFFVRFDLLLMHERGPPPFTSAVTQAQFNTGLGARF